MAQRLNKKGGERTRGWSDDKDDGLKSHGTSLKDHGTGLKDHGKGLKDHGGGNRKAAHTGASKKDARR